MCLSRDSVQGELLQGTRVVSRNTILPLKLLRLNLCKATVCKGCVVWRMDLFHLCWINHCLMRKFLFLLWTLSAERVNSRIKRAYSPDLPAEHRFMQHCVWLIVSSGARWSLFLPMVVGNI